VGRPAKNLAGQKFGRLTALAREEEAPSGAGISARWMCRCDCGATTTVTSDRLTQGRTKSCGCYAIERIAKQSTTHGMSHSSEYSIWRGMLARCSNKNLDEFPRYGGRGIKVCERWHSFENFYADMGKRPAGCTLDRVDNDGDYEPANCRWATRREQQNNRCNTARLTVAGTTRSLSQWCDVLGLARSTVRSRLERGWSDERALMVDAP
jgi:hypothetical protein